MHATKKKGPQNCVNALGKQTQNEAQCGNESPNIDKDTTPNQQATAETMRICLLVDRVPQTKKPEGAEIAAIRHRLAQPAAKEHLTAEEIAKAIEAGCTIMPAYCVGGTTLSHWNSQQLFVIDVDNVDSQGNPLPVGRMLQPEMVDKECAKLGLEACFVHESMSSTAEHPRMHIGFLLDEPVKDIEAAQRALKGLLAAFPAADKRTDLVHMYFGAKGGVRVC